MTTAFERKLVSDAQLHKEWQSEIDRRDDIIYSNEKIIADLRTELDAMTTRVDRALADLAGSQKPDADVAERVDNSMMNPIDWTKPTIRELARAALAAMKGQKP